jgi:hypothetical protein
VRFGGLVLPFTPTNKLAFYHMQMSTRSSTIVKAHNTRHAKDRRPPKPPTSNKAPKSAKKRKDGNKDDHGWYVVNPAIWIDDKEPLITNDSLIAEEAIAVFEHAEDYTCLNDVDEEMARNFYEDCEAERVNREERQMYTVVLPSKGSGTEAFITCNPRTIREFVEDRDSNARLSGEHTLTKAQDNLKKYLAASQKEKTNYDMLKIEVETVTAESEDEEVVVAGLKPEATKAIESVERPPDDKGGLDTAGMENISAKHPEGTTKGDTSQLVNTVTEALEYLRRKQEQPGWCAVLPHFDTPYQAFATENSDEADLFVTTHHGTTVEHGLTKHQALGCTERYNQDKLKHLMIVGNEEQITGGKLEKSGSGVGDPNKVSSEKPDNPYITPEKTKGQASSALLSPPAPPKTERNVTFAQNANFHPSFMPLEKAETLQKKLTLAISGKPKAKRVSGTSTSETASPTKMLRLSYEEVIAKRLAEKQKQLDRTGYDLKVSYFEPVTGFQDFIVVSVEIVRSSDGKTPHWLMKWFLAAKVLADTNPKFSTSRTWFKTCSSALIRATPFGSNCERTNSKNYPEHQLFGLVSKGELEDIEPLEHVCKNLAHDLKVAMESSTFQTEYLGLLNTHYPKVHGMMVQQQKRGPDKKGLWDEIATSTVKCQGYRSLDAAFLDGEIREIATILFDPEDSNNRWPNEIRFACYRNGELPWDIW